MMADMDIEIQTSTVKDMNTEGEANTEEGDPNSESETKIEEDNANTEGETKSEENLNNDGEPIMVRGRGRGRGRRASTVVDGETEIEASATRGRGRGRGRRRGRPRKVVVDVSTDSDTSESDDDDDDDDDPSSPQSRGAQPSNEASGNPSDAKSDDEEEKVFTLSPPSDGITLDDFEINQIVYSVHGRVGEGRYSVVHKFKSTLGTLALKLWRNQTRFSQDAAAQLINEAVITQRCRSENVVEFVGYYLVPPAVCMVTRYCHYGTLTRYYADNRSTAYIRSKDFLHDLENAVAYVHELGYLHRDIKPDNCFVEWSPTAGRLGLRLGDFGHAVEAENAGVAVRGTDAWAAPELDRLGRATQKSDIFSVGLVAFFLLNGFPPGNTATVFLKSDSDLNWARVVLECTKHSPEKRPGHDRLKELIEMAPRLEKFPSSNYRLRSEDVFRSDKIGCKGKNEGKDVGKNGNDKEKCDEGKEMGKNGNDKEKGDEGKEMGKNGNDKEKGDEGKEVGKNGNDKEEKDDDGDEKKEGSLNCPKEGDDKEKEKGNDNNNDNKKFDDKKNENDGDDGDDKKDGDYEEVEEDDEDDEEKPPPHKIKKEE